MKVSGFSFIRNAVKYQYPVAEALRSILPLCDEVVVAVGDSDDGTRNLVASLDPKIRIIDTTWDESLREGGKVLAMETNKAFQAIAPDADWCFYIQGDEVVHEDGYDEIREAMDKWQSHNEVDGLLFRYRHFYGSYDYIGTSSNWYRNEIRVIRNDKRIYSYRDAQGFRKAGDQKLNVKPLRAYIHHYGWVREPNAMQAKSNAFEKLWHGDEYEPKVYTEGFNYNEIDALERFTGTHPQIMSEKIKQLNWKFNYDPTYDNPSIKDRFKNAVEKLTGKRPFEYRNYKII